ncbi:histidine kinase dimerization/phospho-acceptor domain-containing protein [Pontiellaceae bacterium B1224]|nr:histidine kinase dimerization/phospho-acceptor domain-containing protein [Pontiellaceae bacterium B1224]
MISIRARLLSTLLPAFVCISIAAGFSIYFSTKAEYLARLDTELANIAIDLRFIKPEANRDPNRDPNREAPRNQSNFRIRNMPQERLNSSRLVGGMAQLKDTLFTNLSENVYCEVWLGNRGGNLKTDNLAGGEITRPDAFGNTAVFYNTTLENGSPLRAWAARFPIMMREKQAPEVILAVDRREIDAALVRLARNLIGGGLAACLLFSGLLIFTLRISLRPLKILGEQAAMMDAESLHERFSEQSAPADIRPIVVRLNSLMAKLEESFARERRFSGDLAHELRTPLAAIRTTAEVALKWPDQASPDDFDEIHKLSSSLQQTLDSLLLLSRMESSTAEQHIVTVHPAKLAEECIALHAGKAEESRIQLHAELNPSVSLDTDPRLLRIIMTNLISNAVEYTAQNNTVKILVGAEDALFLCENEAPDLQEEDINHLFERMWRKDTARTESNHAGMGLSIAKACANALNLELTVELVNGRLRIALKTQNT